ncbi:MAG: hypothetical protein WCC17_08740, partial [Candidatus Nitrosopolaris sp.]
IASSIEEKEWKPFRNSLDKSDRKIFDEMFSIAHLYNSASSYAAKPIRIQPIFMSIIFHHYKQLARLSKEIEDRDSRSSNYTVEIRLSVTPTNR